MIISVLCCESNIVVNPFHPDFGKLKARSTNKDKIATSRECTCITPCTLHTARAMGGKPDERGSSVEGDIIPIVVIRPLYPREAAISGIEGWVKVEFTITAIGTVKNPKVIDAKPLRMFNREAIRAILKWKFKPRIVSGVAVERRATQVIDFNLDEAGGF